MCLSHFRKIPAKSLTLEMELPSPHHYVYLDRVCSSHQLQKERKEKNPNNYHLPRSVARTSKRGRGRPGGMSEFWPNFQTKAAERSRGQEPRSEILMGIAQSTVLNGQAAPLFLLLGLSSCPC